MAFTVFVTVVEKRTNINIWNKVRLSLAGDQSDLNNLIEQLKLVKSDVNSDMNKKGFSLKDVNIIISNTID